MILLHCRTTKSFVPVKKEGLFDVLTYEGIESSGPNCGMDISTGIFQAPTAGTYSFVVHAIVQKSNNVGEIQLLRNGIDVARAVNFSADPISICASATLKLAQSDKVCAKFLGASEAVGTHIYFHGVQLAKQ